MTIRMQLVRGFVFAALASAMPRAVHAQDVKGRALDATLRAYQLTMPKLDAWMLAGSEIARAFKGRTPPTLGRDDAKSIDEMAAQYDAMPEMRRAIRKAKLSTKEYATLSLVIMQAMMAEQVLDQNPSASPPANLNPANLAFVRANKAALEMKFKAVKGS